MRKLQRVWATIAGSIVLLSLLAACGPTSGGSTGATIKNGGSILDAFQQEPDTMLPGFTASTFAVMAQTTIWAPLYYGDTQSVFHAGIATQVPSLANGGVSSDLKSLTIKLRSGLKWSDGTPITSDDCVFTYTLFSNPAATSLGFPLATDKDPIGFVSATAVDPQTFKVTFRNAAASIVSRLVDAASTCLPKEIYGSIAPAGVKQSPEAFKPTVTSGPFILTDRVAGDHITVKRNPNYYQPNLPHLDQINIKIITDQSTILTAYQTGTADTGWFLDSTKIDSYKALTGYTEGVDRGAGFEWLSFNLHNPILADLKVRQALSMSIKPSDLYDRIYHGVAQATCDDHYGNFAHEDNLTCYTYDPNAAGTLLDGDGWTMGSDGYRHKNGQLLELNYVTTTKAARKDTQVIFQDSWKKVGIKVNTSNLLSQNYFGLSGALCKGQYDIGEYASGGGYDPDDHIRWLTEQDCAHGGQNYGFYSNSTVDQAEATQLGTLDVNARKAAFRTIHAEIIKDLPVIYLFVAKNVWVHNNHLHNYDPSPLGGSETWNVWDWYRDDV